MRNPPALAGAWAILTATRAAAAGKKPLFEYDDHYVMLNDFGRNDFYRRALERVVPACGDGCSVLDVGAGSGLLSMMAANLGAPHVFAIEANPALADLATRTIASNQPSFPASNVTVVANLSSRVFPDQMPLGRPADILVTETFGTMLLGEGAINFVPDARDRLLKAGGVIVPAGGCQYVTLVDMPAFAATASPGAWEDLNLSRLGGLQDTVYWKATMGASNVPYEPLIDRLCVLEVDLYKDTKESIPENRTFRVRATRSGTVHAALFDWDVWADASRADILSTARGSRNFAGDVAWGQLFQLQEEVGADWRHGEHPTRLEVKAGDWLDIGVEFIARGISAHVRARHAIDGGETAGSLPPSLGAPARLRGVNRGDVVEASEYWLPLAGDADRHRFYTAALRAAVLSLSGREAPTVLDCSAGGGVPALVAAKAHGLKSLAVTRRNEFARVLRKVATDNGLDELVESYASDPRDLLEALLPQGEKADIVVVEPPGTPMHGLSPFAQLPLIRKRLLKEGGVIVPAGGCLEVALIESTDLAHLFSVPGGRWRDINLTVWNEEARRQGILDRLVPYTKWLGPHSTMQQRWLSAPRCAFEVDLQAYGDAANPPPAEEVTEIPLHVTVTGVASALVARWTVWGSSDERSARLGAEAEGGASSYLGRSLTWPQYVQAVAAPGTGPGLLEPVALSAGDTRMLRVVVRQGAAKVTGVAGPEVSFRLDGTDGSERGGLSKGDGTEL